MNGADPIVEDETIKLTTRFTYLRLVMMVQIPQDKSEEIASKLQYFFNYYKVTFK